MPLRTTSWVGVRVYARFRHGIGGAFAAEIGAQDAARPTSCNSYWILLRREGWRDNKKRVHRLYRLEGLQVRMRARRKKRLSLHRGVVPPASGRDQAWSMDFVHDQLVTGRAFRMLTVVDQWSRESVLMEANVALTGQSVVDVLDALAARCPLRKAITVDHGTEFTSKALDEWAYRRGVALDFIRPGKPVENAVDRQFQWPSA